MSRIYGDMSDLEEEVHTWMFEEGNFPQAPSENALFEAIYRFNESRDGRGIADNLAYNMHPMPKEQFSRFKKWFLRKGLDEGWLEDEYFPM